MPELLQNVNVLFGCPRNASRGRRCHTVDNIRGNMTGPPHERPTATVPEGWSLAERVRAAQDPLTPPAILERLALDGDPDVRQAVALNGAAPPRALAFLVRDTGMTEAERRAPDVQRQIREFALVHANLPPAVLEQLSEDPDVTILQIVARQPHTPAAALERLAASTDAGVRRGGGEQPECARCGPGVAGQGCRPMDTGGSPAALGRPIGGSARRGRRQ